MRRELAGRRREKLRRSLENPHPETITFAEQDLEKWSDGLPDEDSEALLDSTVGKAVRWVPSKGWVEDRA